MFLIDAGSEKFVRKSARSADQNERLHAQCNKLRRAHKLGVSCPKVVNEGKAGDLFFFDMDYIPGETLANAIISGRQLNWATLNKQIIFLLAIYQSANVGTIPAKSFLTKLRQVESKCRGMPALQSAMGRVELIVERLSSMDWSNIPNSEAHGDLTFENILLHQDDTISFIDFDVPEHCSWVLDIGKMYQDIFGHWCLRKLVLGGAVAAEILNAQLRLQDAALQMREGIEGLIPGGVPSLRQYSAFHLLRTLPYARESHLPLYVIEKIDEILG